MFTLEMSTDNAAFDGDRANEIWNVLYELASKVSLALTDESIEHAEFPLFDTNGNRIGTAVYNANA